MQSNPSNKASQITVQTSRQLIQDPDFCDRHRTSSKYFTRNRCLTFMNVVTLLLQKTVRSIQAHLTDFFLHLLPDSSPVSPASWCEARLKLSHTAFIELNQRAVLEVVYGGKSDFVPRRWKGHRVLAIDSSLIRLPNRESLGKEFGWVECTNQVGPSGQYPQERLSVWTDLLNRIAVHTLLVPWKQGERDLAGEHVKAMQPEDVSILDRGYASYELWAQFTKCQRLFICRCATSSFSVVNQLFKENRAGRSVVVTLRPSSKKLPQVRGEELPEEIQVRFVTVRLSTGELEVLATNLLDESHYPTEEFKDVYHFRWSIEVYYNLIKGRLDLENFTGFSAEAVRQDLYATIFLSNLESILIQPSQAQLRTKSQGCKNQKQVNHAVSFHAIKSQIISLLLSSKPIPEVLIHLERMFLSNPICNRPARIVSRKPPSAWRSYQYQRNIKKMVF